ncbi:preprotein translocase subunit YajC [Parvularcula dongshanensis]|uniref:Sec translocon accessory complex subunit YajC n=1 Tax=Parvularcula dongshanensis TaxID=1173995 RepID=A0A840I8S4_9PROT|nr:preprotein translocase subunit YajC [Parvularcula dongshanensis]MBB4660350.1 preprotein translocase subunit YajC [Parvularcula dongshanensis]
MFLSAAYAQDAAAQQPNFFTSLIPFVLMAVVFYFLLIRPQQQARKKHQAMVAGVKRGDEVLTSGGILGKVVKAPEGDECTIEIAEGVQVRVVKATLTDVRGKGTAAAAPAKTKA